MKHVTALTTIFISLVISNLFLSLDLYAQDSLSEKAITEQIWIDNNASFRIHERLVVYGYAGVRTVFPHEWNRYIFRPSVRYQKRKLFFEKRYYTEELHAGIGLFFTDNRNSSNRFEIRPFQGYRLAWPNRPLKKYEKPFGSLNGTKK